MTNEEHRLELIEWGKYNESRGLDISLAVYREVMAAQRPHPGAREEYVDTHPAVRPTKPGPGRPEHLEENKALAEEALPTTYPSDKVIAARERDAHAKSLYEANMQDPPPVVDPVVPDAVEAPPPAPAPWEGEPPTDDQLKRDLTDAIESVEDPDTGKHMHIEARDEPTEVVERKGKRR